jgi:hypothetical protein
VKRLRAIFRMAPDGGYTFDVRDLRQFRLILGPEVVSRFVSCAIQADRLLSLSHFQTGVMKLFRKGSIGEKRQFLVMVVFAIGTLREFAIVLPGLRGLLLKRKLIGKTEWPAELQTIETTWEKTEKMIDLRDQTAFHLNPDRLEAAMKTAEKLRRRIFLEGDSEKSRDSWFRLGADVQLLMIGATAKERENVTDLVFEGIESAAKSLELLLFAVIEHARLTIEKRDLRPLPPGSTEVM